MGHIKNHDTIKLQLLDIAACFIWPVLLMKKHFIRDSEILCDNRVLGLLQGEQDLYSELIVRECSAQKAVRGLGFSDSFHTVKSRLNAIYSRCPERHRIAVFAVAMAFVLVGTCLYASQHQAAWLKTYTEADVAFQPEGEFDILVRYEDEEGYNGLNYFMPNTFPLFMGISDMDTINQVISGTYSYADGQLLVDKKALYAYLRPYIEKGLVVTEVSYVKHTDQYVDTSRESLVWEETAGGIVTLDRRSTRIYILSITELEQADESNQIASFNVPHMTWAERANEFVAHWL